MLPDGSMVMPLECSARVGICRSSRPSVVQQVDVVRIDLIDHPQAFVVACRPLGI